MDLYGKSFFQQCLYDFLFGSKPYNEISNSSLYEFMEKDKDGSSIHNVFRADITLLLSSGLFGRTEDLRAGC